MLLRRDMRSVTVEATIDSADRLVHCLRLQLVTDVVVAARAQGLCGRAEEGRIGAGVRLVTGSAVTAGGCVRRSASGCHSGHVMAGRANLCGTGVQQSGTLGSVGKMTGVAVTAGEWLMLWQVGGGFEKAVVAAVAELCTLSQEESTPAGVGLMT